eukprot:s339_g2.t1
MQRRSPGTAPEHRGLLEACSLAQDHDEVEPGEAWNLFDEGGLGNILNKKGDPSEPMHALPLGPGAKSPGAAVHEPEVDTALPTFSGLRFGEMGDSILRALQKYVWQPHGKTMTMASDTIFPLPLEGYNGIPCEGLVWLSAVLLALNSLYGDARTSQRPPSEVQKKLVAGIWEFLQRMLRFHEQAPELTLASLFDVKGVDYRGEEVRLAQSFRWDNIKGALPQEVGTLDLASFCSGGCLHYVENFESYLLPLECQRLGRVPRILVDEQDWNEVVSGLISSGICEVYPVERLYHLGDTPLLNGLFSVSKNEFSETGVELHRLIMNMVPLNNLCRSLKGDVGTLPTIAGLSAFFLENNEVAVMASEDIKCFYYLFQIPDSWRRFMGFARPVPPCHVPLQWQGKTCHLVAKVLPMGFINSVGLAQHIHRNVVRQSLAEANLGFGGERELRRDRPAPLGKELFRVYLDNWDEVRKVDREFADEIEGKPSLQQLAIRQRYLDVRLPRHPKKSVESSCIAEIQGALLDGRAGVAYAKPEKILKYMTLAWELIQRGTASLRELQIVAGGLVYITMFRRPLLCSLNEVWCQMEALKGYPPVVRLPLPRGVRLELSRFLALIPLAQLDFRLPMRREVTASDASSSGGGICCSTGLTSYGLSAQQALVRGGFPEPLEVVDVLTVGLFDGIGALRVAADVLQLPVVGHISVECNDHANRVLESGFPGSHTIKTVEEVDTAEGSQRDARSSLYKEIPRIFKLIRTAMPWAQVHLFTESVASMDPKDRAAMSQDLGLVPNRVDSSGISLARRPRLYWLTWELTSEPGMQLEPPQGSGWTEFRNIHLSAEVDQKDFLEAGWFIPDGNRLATFTTSRPSAAPGRRPAGLHSCDEDTIERWRQDLHRYPPYQYKPEYCVHHGSGQLRVATIAEREVILGFPVGYTLNCVRKSDQKAAWVADVRKTLLGNSWSVGVVICLLKQLFETLGIIQPCSIQELVNRLVPGKSEQLQAILQRPPLRREVPVLHQEDGLARRLSGLVSIKGEDLLLQAASEPLVRHQRLRATVPSRLWKWRDVSGWAWRSPGEHINQLEMRAVLTSVKYWVAGPVEKMGKGQKRLEGRTQKDRQRIRKQMGSLKSLTIQPRTRARYDKAKAKFYAFLTQNSLELPHQRAFMDGLLCDYLEHLWASGEGRALASDTLAALQDTSPKLKGALPGAWRLLKTWHVNEIPCRAPPLPERILLTLVGYFLFHSMPDMALSVLLGFYSMLRTGELLGIRNKDVTIDDQHRSAVISLGFTKGGKRAGAAESVTVTVTDVIRRLAQWKQSTSPGSLLTPAPHVWRKAFAQALEALSLQSCEFRPYSLRRGGATFWFGQHGSLDRILLQGRWMAARTARTYLNEGLAVLAEMKIPFKPLKPFHTDTWAYWTRLGEKGAACDAPGPSTDGVTCRAALRPEAGKSKKLVGSVRSEKSEELRQEVQKLNESCGGDPGGRRGTSYSDWLTDFFWEIFESGLRTMPKTKSEDRGMGFCPHGSKWCLRDELNLWPIGSRSASRGKNGGCGGTVAQDRQVPQMERSKEKAVETRL